MMWKENKRQRFVNPYNFVPFMEKVEKGNAPACGGDVLTGYIECELTLLTPLFIPNTSNDQAFHVRRDEKDASCSYDFFSYQNLAGIKKTVFSEPVIPGSEIRGAVRSVYEAAFCGCASFVDFKRVLQRRSPKAKRAGILRKEEGTWKVEPCKRVGISLKEVTTAQRYKEWREGQTVFLHCCGKKVQVAAHKSEIEEDDKNKVWKEGYLHKGEPFINKKCEAVFVVTGQKKLSVDENEVNFLRQAVKEYKNKGYYSEYEVKETQTLVYYQLQGEKPRYLSPACIGKELFEQSMEDLLKWSKVQPCEDRGHLCPACALFGMVAKEKRERGAAGSKIRFTDAVLCEPEVDLKEYYLSDIFLPEMGEPKPGAVEFYTVPPLEIHEKYGYGYWTYDYYQKSAGGERFYFKENSDQLKLRGRKFYWHSDPDMKKYEGQKANDGNQNMRQKVRLLKSSIEGQDVKFTFKIYFEDISLLELEQLIWALDFNDSTCAHKLGRGKPLGFGSVRIEVKRPIQQRVIAEDGKWEIKELKIEERNKIIAKDHMKTLRQIMQWKKRFTSPVCYPLGEDKTKKADETDTNNLTASHQWFTGNRSIRKGASSTKPLFDKVLPTIEEEQGAVTEKWLYKLEKD